MFQLEDANVDKTIENEFPMSGIALHSGQKSEIIFKPAKTPGISFHYNGNIIPASANFSLQNVRGTSLGELFVVEHVLSALSGLGITSVNIFLSHFEPPAFDGSALPIVEALRSAGIKNLPFSRLLYFADSPQHFEDGDASVDIFPSDRFEIDFMVKFPIIGQQNYSFIPASSEDYIKEIAPARTFGFTNELEKLKKLGLARGATVDSALAIGEMGYLNAPRFPDEPVRHKILDLIGDLSLSTIGLRCKFVANKSGHNLNLSVAKYLLKELELFKGGHNV